MREVLFYLGIILVIGLFVAGCTGTQKGATGGAIVGAGIGAIVGHQSGETAKGAAIGAAVGGLAGALIGDQVLEDDQPAKASANTVQQSAPEPQPEVVQERVKFCPVCGRIYPADMEYCPKDGAKLRWKED